DIRKITKEVYQLRPTSRTSASSIAMTLLRTQVDNGSADPQVTFHDIVKVELGIIGDSVPQKEAERYAEHLRAVRDDRYAIKDEIEDTGEFSLAIVDELGRSAMRSGGLPSAGFVIRASQLGVQDSAAHMRMGIGKVRRGVQRAQQTHRINDEDS